MTASYVTKRLHQISPWAIISLSTILTQEEQKMHPLALWCLSLALLAMLCPKSQRKFIHANTALMSADIRHTSSDTLTLTLPIKSKLAAQKSHLGNGKFIIMLFSHFLHFCTQCKNNFTDVTLVCEDGQQVEAHKMILAASNLLLGRNQHPQPLIYMRGIWSNILRHLTVEDIT